MAAPDVLYATDFSESSEVAGRVARDMAVQSGARLHVVYVIPPVTDPGDSAADLDKAAARLGPGLTIEKAVLAGRPARQIVGYAREKGIGLIVLGTHGRTGVSRVILGSVAEAVVRSAPCPVLTVPPRTRVGDAALEAERVAGAFKGHRCLVCSRESEDLICEPCRALIRGGALHRKVEEEKAGRRGSPV